MDCPHGCTNLGYPMGLNAIKNNPTQKEQHEFLRGNLSETKQGGKTFLVKEERLQQWMIAGLKALCYYFQLSLSEENNLISFKDQGKRRQLPLHVFDRVIVIV